MHHQQQQQHAGAGLLCDFEDPEEPERPEGRQAERAGPLSKVDPEHLQDGPEDDEAVEAVESWRKVGGRAQRVHADPHLEDEEPEEHKLGVNCNVIDQFQFI